MEIGSIDQVLSTPRVAKKEAILTAQLEDTLSISSEVLKKGEWVEMLKQMPDVRPDKIEEALRSEAFHHPEKFFSEVALQLIRNP